jgi:hypothetical protein
MIVLRESFDHSIHALYANSIHTEMFRVIMTTSAFYQLNFQGPNKVLRGPGAVVSASGGCRVCAILLSPRKHVLIDPNAMN